MARRSTFVALCLAAAVSACTGSSAPTAPEEEHSLRVVALSPAVGETLPRGAAASVSLTVTSEAPGLLTLSLRDQAGALVVSREPPIDVAAGVPTTLEVSFAVPSSAARIELRADFRPTSAAVTPTVLQVEYAVR